MARKIYWLSESIGPIQRQALAELHGTDAEVVEDLIQFTTSEALASYIREKGSDFVYALEHAGSVQIIAEAAKISGLTFGTVVSEYEGDAPRTTQLVWFNWPSQNKVSSVWPDTAKAQSRN